jgi:hypothetical protein
MTNKKQPESKKVLDISRPKKRSASGATAATPLVIPKRTVINPVINDESAPDTPATPLQLKHVAKAIEPTSAPELSTPIDTGANSESKSATTEDTPQTSAASNEQKASDAAQKPARAETPETDAAEASVSSTEDASASTETRSEAEGKSPEHPDVRKALEEAKREEQIQGYIEKHEFFVPINAVARKRSIKVTIGLIIIEVILGLFLLNLMLDAGLIFLLEKIPHTNFFDLQ